MVLNNSEYCHSAWALPSHLAMAAFVLLGATLLEASWQQAKPLKQMGQRPLGRGLWSWYFHSARSSKLSGCQGYDPILGAHSPSSRIRIHTSIALLAWSVLYYAWPLLGMEEVCEQALEEDVLFAWLGPIPLSFSMSGMVAIGTYMYSLWVIWSWCPGVSDPGGPRPHKIGRQPQWESIDHQPFGSKMLSFWSAQDAHRETEHRLAGTGAALTGEPAGRDLWSPRAAPAAAPMRGVNEELVQQLAWGGRKDRTFCPARNPNSCDAPFRAQMIRQYLKDNPKVAGSPQLRQSSTTVDSAIDAGAQFYAMLQTSDGHWAGDYGGPHFLLPGLVVAWYVMGQPEKIMLTPEHRTGMIHYLRVHQQADGGWGTHIESPSTMFGTTISYVALRLLGVGADEDVCKRGSEFIRAQQGALYTSSWAKFYLCLLGCMEWDGHNSVPAEIFLLPNWFPFHPGRMWCHARMVYLPMAYLYGSRFVYAKAETDPLIQDLRKELYVQDYDSIDWIRTRHWVAPMDNYSPIGWFMKTAQNVLARYETWGILRPLRMALRSRGLAFCVQYMHAEDLQTNFIDIGPVNKVLNMISAFHIHDGDIHHSNVVNHVARVDDYLWVAEDGVKVKGYNGSQCWDTSFAIQAYYEAGLLDKFPEVSRKVYSYLERCQILSTEVSQKTAAYMYEEAGYRSEFYRHVSQGGWPFSTSAHGWPISDCTGEGLKGVLCLLQCSTIQESLEKDQLREISDKRLHDACNVLLSYQNEDGGFATYENNRGFGFYEWLNPSEVFGDIMIDYSYVECSMASLTALVDFQHRFPYHRTEEVQHSVAKGRDFLKTLQRPDGSWYGSWACCFCYGGWFGVEGLVKCGEPRDSPSIVNACKFLLRHQRPNGGWGEDFTSCYDKDYAANGMEAYGDDGSGVINTAWALLALAAAESPNVDAVRRGVNYLVQRQLPGGDWPQEGVAGVFNRACGITYTAYRNVFPLWALGRCRQVYGKELEQKTS